MTRTPPDQPSAPTPEQLREQVEQTHHDLGQTVQALADKTDGKTSSRQKATRFAWLARDNRTVLLVAAASVTVLWLAGHRKKG